MELAFLYQTRTILRLRPEVARTAQRHAKRPLSASALVLSSFLQRKAAAVAATNSTRNDDVTTLSAQEERIFQRLQLYKDPQELNARLGVPAPETDQLDISPERLLALFTPRQKASVDDDTLHPDQSSGTSESSPGKLRAPPITTESIAQQICLGETREFARAARQALESKTEPGDLALYKLLEARVFPLIEVLGLKGKLRKRAAQKSANAATDTPAAKVDKSHPLLNIPALVKKHGSHLTAPSFSVSKPSVPPSTSPSTPNTTTTTSKHQGPPLPSPLTVLTRLYPTLLLLTLRLLVLHHPLSILTSSLLPRIRHLGPITSSEMERGGVEFDLGTLGVLRGMTDERSADLSGQSEQGGTTEGRNPAHYRGREFWLAPTQAELWPKVEEWQSIIELRLRESGLGEVMRESGGSSSAIGVDGRSVNVGIGAQEIEVPRVWL
ncbi:uncharacterized protein AB675_2146 [Cyphellophora attinorum]|uniref:Uncharacterized protein n=1 Tax=Cyphellophora attinorum TaxID=1664694 RepID=A0A0N1H7Q7_9EURO|nr:uncharacterized protein AB675_2146 [Phialophora attinorum]KPI42650.1 hypothetical protein AB675_2146 [Phialophora attinorum]